MNTALAPTEEERAPFLPGIGDLAFAPGEIALVRADAEAHKHTGNQVRDNNAVLYRAVVALRSVAMADVDIARTLGCSRNTVRAIGQHEDAMLLVEQGKKGMSRKLLVSGFRVLQAALSAAHTVGPRDQAVIGGIALDHGRELDAVAMGEGAGSGEAKGQSADDIREKIRAVLAGCQVVEGGQSDEASDGKDIQANALQLLVKPLAYLDPACDPCPGLELAADGQGGGGVATPGGPEKSMGTDSENLNRKRKGSASAEALLDISPADIAPDPVAKPQPPEKGTP